MIIILTTWQSEALIFSQLFWGKLYIKPNIFGTKFPWKKWSLELDFALQKSKYVWKKTFMIQKCQFHDVIPFEVTLINNLSFPCNRASNFYTSKVRGGVWSAFTEDEAATNVSSSFLFGCSRIRFLHWFQKYFFPSKRSIKHQWGG